MLILTRRPDESIVLGGDVTVTVLEIKGGVVRLGIDAPRDVRVDREEIALRRRAEREARGESGAGAGAEAAAGAGEDGSP